MERRVARSAWWDTESPLHLLDRRRREPRPEVIDNPHIIPEPRMVDLSESLRADTDRAALAAELAEPRRAEDAAHHRRIVRRARHRW